MKIAAGSTANGARWSVDIFGPWVDLIAETMGRSAANGVVRWSLVEVGYTWASKCLGRRFTNYVKARPFFYKLGLDKRVAKFRRLGFLQPILAKEFFGWDPWSPAGPPKELVDQYRRLYPEAKGVLSRSGNYLTLSRTIRQNSKRIVRDFVDDLSHSKLLPLVETGLARQTALAGHRARATATAKVRNLRITVPFGAARNRVVGAIVTRLPDSELTVIASDLETILTRRLTRTGVAAPGPRPQRSAA